VRKVRGPRLSGNGKSSAEGGRSPETLSVPPDLGVIPLPSRVARDTHRARPLPGRQPGEVPQLDHFGLAGSSRASSSRRRSCWIGGVPVRPRHFRATSLQIHPALAPSSFELSLRRADSTSMRRLCLVLERREVPGRPFQSPPARFPSTSPDCRACAPGGGPGPSAPRLLCHALGGRASRVFVVERLGSTRYSALGSPAAAAAGVCRDVRPMTMRISAAVTLAYLKRDT